MSEPARTVIAPESAIFAWGHNVELEKWPVYLWSPASAPWGSHWPKASMWTWTWGWAV